MWYNKFCRVKKESEIILYHKLKCDTKEIIKLLEIVTIALFIILTIIFIKYNPVYEVKIDGETIGYIKSKQAMEETINNEILALDNPCAVFSTLDKQPTYELKLAEIKQTDEEKVKQILEENKTTMYKQYAITIDNEIKTHVDTFEQAEEIVNEMKENYSEDIAQISIIENYTKNLDEIGTELTVAKASVDSNMKEIKDEKARIASATFNGVYFQIKPVMGNITSRYGAVESIRDHAHGGLDIAAPYGTDIKASANGTISYSGWMSGYGNLIIIDHENGVQSYYGHCSKLYATVGTVVEAGDIIAAVGSTGNSTGNHLHFEIRLNGSSINPQKYIYK